MKTNKWINLIGSIALIATMTGCDGEDGGVNDDTINNDNNTNTELATRVTVSSDDYFVTELKRFRFDNIGLDNYSVEIENGFQTYEEFFGKKLACVLNVKYSIYADSNATDQYADFATFRPTITDSLTPKPTADNIVELITTWGFDKQIQVPACDVVILTGFDTTNLNSSKNSWTITDEEILNRVKVLSTYYKSLGAEIAMYKVDYDYSNYIQTVPEVSLLITNKNNIVEYYDNSRIVNGFTSYGVDAVDNSIIIITDYFKNKYSDLEIEGLMDEWNGNISFDINSSIILEDIYFTESPEYQ